MLVDRKCIRFGKCVESCTLEAITLDNSGRKVDWQKCNQCMDCAAKCPSGAIEAVGRYFTVEEVVSEVEKDRLFYQNSGGGVSLSGGEPLLQWVFALNLLKECKVRNLHTTLDTSGYASWDVMDRVIEYVDLVLYDIKQMDSTKHKVLTGVTNDLILDNAERVSRKVTTWIRYTVVPGYNTSASDIENAARFAAKLTIEKVSLLPYHRMGVQKFKGLGRTYRLSRILPPTLEFLESIQKVFESFGLKVTINN